MGNSFGLAGSSWLAGWCLWHLTSESTLGFFQVYSHTATFQITLGKWGKMSLKLRVIIDLYYPVCSCASAYSSHLEIGTKRHLLFSEEWQSVSQEHFETQFCWFNWGWNQWDVFQRKLKGHRFVAHLSCPLEAASLQAHPDTHYQNFKRYSYSIVLRLIWNISWNLTKRSK